MHLTQINIYPIKSMAGIQLEECELDRFGLKYDRRWMVVDENGRFLTQRQKAEMCFFTVTMNDEGLEVKHRKKKGWKISVPYQPISNEQMDVMVWNDQVKAPIVDPRIDRDLSQLFGQEVHLVMMADDAVRTVDSRYAPSGINTAFSDGYPLLMIGEESLHLLNTRLETNVEMERFRPNLVFAGGEAHCEDQKGKWQIGKVSFKAVKPCSRCVITTINRETAQKSPEPLRTLSKYRLQEGKVMFGMNLIHTPPGKIKLGDKVAFIG